MGLWTTLDLVMVAAADKQSAVAIEAVFACEFVRRVAGLETGLGQTAEAVLCPVTETELEVLLGAVAVAFADDVSKRKGLRVMPK